MFHPRPSSALGQFYSKKGDQPSEVESPSASDEHRKGVEADKLKSCSINLTKLEPAKGYLELASKNIYDKHYLIQLIFALQKCANLAPQNVLKFRFVDFILPKESARPFFEQDSFCQKKNQDDVTSHKRGFNFRVAPVRGLCMQNPTNVGQGKGGGFGNLRIPFDAGVSDGLKRMDFINAGTRSEDPLWHKSLPETGSLDFATSAMAGTTVQGVAGAGGVQGGALDYFKSSGLPFNAPGAAPCGSVQPFTSCRESGEALGERVQGGTFTSSVVQSGTASSATTTTTAARKYTEAIKGLKKNFGLRKGDGGMLFADGGSYDVVADKHSGNGPKGSNAAGSWSFPSERLQEASNGTRQIDCGTLHDPLRVQDSLRVQDPLRVQGGALDSFKGSGGAQSGQGGALNATTSVAQNGGAKGGSQSYLERLFDKSFERSARQQEFGEGVTSVWSASQSQSSFNGNSCDLNWQYMDPQGQVHGPFDSRQMHKWYLKNFFPPNLAMRFSVHEPWRCFKDYYPPGTIPFKDYPRGAVKNNGKVGAPADLVQDIVQMPSIQDIISSPRSGEGTAEAAPVQGAAVAASCAGERVHDSQRVHAVERVHDSQRKQGLSFTGSGVQGTALDSFKGSGGAFGVQGGALTSSVAVTSSVPVTETPLSRFKDGSKSPSANVTPKRRQQFQGKPRQSATVPSTSFVAASARLASLTLSSLDSGATATATSQAEPGSNTTTTTLKQQPHVWNRPGDIVVDSLVDIMKAQESTAAAAAASASQALHSTSASTSMESKPKHHVKTGWNFDGNDSRTSPATLQTGSGRGSGNVLGNSANGGGNYHGNGNEQDGDDDDEDFPTLSTHTTTRRTRHPNTETATTTSAGAAGGASASGNNTSHGQYSSYSAPSIGKMPLKLFMEQTKGNAPIAHSRVDASETFAAKLMASNNRQHDHI